MYKNACTYLETWSSSPFFSPPPKATAFMFVQNLFSYIKEHSVFVTSVTFSIVKGN